MRIAFGLVLMLGSLSLLLQPARNARRSTKGAELAFGQSRLPKHQEKLALVVLWVVALAGALIGLLLVVGVLQLG